MTVKVTAALASSLALVACGAPEADVTYRDVSAALFPSKILKDGACHSSAHQRASPAGNPSCIGTLEDGQILYALRTTDVTLFPIGGSVASPASDACEPPSGLSKTAQDHWYEAITNDAKQCLKNVTAAPTPAAFHEHVSVVSPSNPPLVKIQLSTAPSASDPLLLNAVTVTYSDNRKQFVADVGTVAAAGFAFGPVGAIIGGGLVGVGYLFAGEIITESSSGQQAPLESPLYLNLICKQDRPYWSDARAKAIEKTKLMLPVTLELTEDGVFRDRSPEDALSDGSPPDPVLAIDSPDNCWHPVPGTINAWADGADYGLSRQKAAQANTTGWLYRFVRMGPQPTQFDTETLQEFFANMQLQTSDTKTPAEMPFETTVETQQFPITPCDTAAVELIWYRDAEKELESSNFTTSSSIRALRAQLLHGALSQPMQVANPLYAQPLTVPRGGSINFGAVCGASVSYTDTFATFDQKMVALLSSIGAIKQAQLGYKKSQ